MKSVAAASAALLSLASISSAQTYQQSKPFYLVVKGCKKFNGAAFVACHEGAAIEGLCVGGKPGDSNGVSTFQHNTTTGAIVAKQTAGEPGVLTFSLPVNGGNETVSEGMQLAYNTASNVALPLFEPTNQPTQVAFDTNNHMNIQSFVDDSVSPAVTRTTAYYRWYVCESYYTSYTYTTLNWVSGKYPPQNPSCEKVDVVRQFA